MRNEKLIFGPGAHFLDPLLIESGILTRHITLGAGATLRATAFVLGTDNNATFRLTVDLTGEGAEFHLHTLYLASGVGESAGSAAIDVRVNHLTPSCVSRQLIKGIASGTSTGSFTGMVHVAPGAQRTDATQRNQNLQLTDTAHVLTRPGLEIYADDVRCSHGATIGRLDPEAVYYLRQRGISESEARRMQMHGFAAEIVNHCPSEDSRRFIGQKISALIDTL